MKKLLKLKRSPFPVFKYDLKMKLSTLFILAALFSMQANDAYGQRTKVTLDLNNVSIGQLIDEIESKTEFEFVYKIKDVDLNRTVSVKVNRERIANVLNQVFQNTRTTFNLNNRRIYLVKRYKPDVSPQPEKYIKENDMQFSVSGAVTDENGQPLPGASIIEKGTSNGISSDFDGNYSIEVSNSDAILQVSYLGYSSQEIAVSGQSTINVQLQPDTGKLEEVVIIGYGSTTKEKFNGAVSKVDSEELNNYSSANFEQALSGNVSGIQILGNGKNPGENSVIQIRGLNTLTAGTNPLIVIDGNPLSEGSSFSSINTQDIESINILKDAASAAIYGSRASNGVILITTKKGRQGSLKVTYDTYYGFQDRIDNFELVDAYDAALFDSDSRNFGYVSGGPGRSISDDNATRDANGGGKRSRVPGYLQGYLDGQAGLTNTNWTDAVFRTASQQNHYLNLSGGTEKTDYSVSFGYLNQENIIMDSDYKRYTANVQLNSEINDHIRFGITSNVSLVNSNPTGEAGWSNYRLSPGAQPDPSFSIILMQPYYPIHNSDGTFAIANQIDDNNDNWDGPISENTVAQTELTDFFERRLRVFGNAYVEVEPWNGLKFKTSLGGDFNSTFTEFFAPSNIGNYRTPVANNRTQAFENNARRENFITENLLTYSKTLDKHTFDALLGFSYQEESRFNTRLESNNFADDNLRNIAGATNPSAIVGRSKWALESYFTRLQYDYDGRYALSGSFRRDGSSRFGANTKYGNFASVSAGWTLSNEEFFPEDGLVSFSKIRASWGQTGNNQIGDFGSIALIESDNYVIDGQLIPGSYTDTSPNPDLSWETNTALNVGLDLGLLDNKLLLTAEYYKSNTTDLLLKVPVPQQSGFSESLQNIGELENKGFEFEIRGNGFEVGDLRLGFNANISASQNEVLALGEGQEQIIQSNGGMGFLTKVGGSIAEFYAYDIEGVFRTQAEIDAAAVTPLAGTEIGDYVVRDANGDGQITPDDRVTLGDYNPDFTYGFGFNLNYNGFDLSAQFTGIEGRKVSDRMVYYAESGEGFFVPSQHYFDNYFSDRNAEGFFRRPDFSSFSSAGRLTRSSSLSVYDADYFRLRSLQLGYNFHESVTEYLGVDFLRIYLTGNNIFNSTKFRGYNPDALDTRTNNNQQTLTRGWIQSASPLTRFVALGLNVKF
ncbi:TonB-dependent receptor [Flagellimonas pacifica]|uniref:TonB-linked outer membrane protein, SusC/RagA family n=1 Tax=Flagellimonas pacifica TaxID=1247520 RepID=A0A285MYB6_9FLAO|nr:TonB-dependent receptor [Allomuricauda parva]SNZ01663.1 TonB-linked outer membrane protein, SusC/RagA family [Allomuricauda parva]